MTKTEIIDQTVPLLKQEEGFLPSPKWDVNAYRWGYSTPWNSYKGLTIDRIEAEKEMREYLAKEYDDLVRTCPTYANDSFAIPLLSKGYHYGSGIFRLYNKLSLEQAIEEFNDEDDIKWKKRREAELYYYRQIKKLPPFSSSSSFVTGILILMSLLLIKIGYDKFIR